MKASSSRQVKKLPSGFTIDPGLAHLQGRNLFPRKLAEANALLAEAGSPEEPAPSKPVAAESKASALPMKPLRVQPKRAA